MLIAHPFVGYQVGKIYQKKKNITLTDSQQLFWNVVAVIGGIGADIDFFLAPLLSIPTFRHRQIFTHTPLFWIIISVLLYLLVYLFGSKLTKFKKIINPKFARSLVTMFFLNTLIHLFLDTISGAIPIFWPIDTTPFTLLGYIIPNPQSSIQYLTHPTFIFELLLITGAIITFYDNNFTSSKTKKFKNKKKTYSSAIFNVFSILFAVLLSTSIILQDKSYKPHSANINFNPDLDFDNVRNSDDTDIDGNGTRNIIDTGRAQQQECINKALENIVSNKILSIPISKQADSPLTRLLKFTPVVQNNMDLVGKVYGECHFSIENDLKSDIIKEPDKYGIESITSYTDLKDVNTLENLAIYIDSSLTMPEVNLLERGNLVLTMDSQGKVSNIFFVWENDENSEAIKVVSTTEDWKIGIIELKKTELYNY